MLSLAQLNSADQPSFTAALGHLFEHSPWVAEETWPKRPFRDAKDLHAQLCATMRAASSERRIALIRAHPDLAGRLAMQGKLTAESQREQASAGLNQLSPEELATFQHLNDAYRSRFDFPFIICARLNAHEAILRALQDRSSNTLEVEQATALAEIEKIAWLRLNDFLSSQ